MTRDLQPILSATRMAFLLIAVISVAAVPAGSAVGQSGSKNPAASQRAAVTGQQSPAELAMGGYCPVCIIENKQWVKGDRQFQVTYDGKTYLFPGKEKRAMFAANPAKYVPALGGDCIVCRSNMGKRVSGSVQHAAFSGGRLYLFPGEKQQQEFLANHEKYVNTDLALGGKCAVCRVEMGEEIAGKSEFAEYYQGRRYLFPGPKQQQMFRANPDRYAVPAPVANQRR